MTTWKAILLAGTAALGFGSSAYAADDAAKPAAALPGGAISEVVVTARKRAEAVQDVPLAINAFGAAALERARIVNVTDVARHTAGLSLQQSSTTQQFQSVIRGQNTLDSTLNLDPAVGIYVDEVYIGPDIGNGIAMNLDDADDVEVLKGPQGTLYGRNTSAGAIKVNHVLPGYERTGWITGDVGNYDLRTLKGAVTIPLVDQLATLRLYGKVTANSGYGRNAYRGMDVQDDRGYDFSGTLRLNPTDKLQIVVRGGYDHDRSGGPSIHPTGILPTVNLATLTIAATHGLPLTPEGIAQAQSLFFSLGPKKFYDMTSRFPTPNELTMYNGSMAISYDLTNDLSIKSITAYRHVNTYRGIDFSGSFAASMITSSEPLWNRQFTQEFIANGQAFDNKLKYTGGVFYMKAKGEDISDATTAPALGAVLGAASPLPTGINREDGVEDTKSFAVYAQATYSLTSRLDLTAGVRYSKEHKDLTAYNQFLAGTYNDGNGAVDPFPPVLNQTAFCLEPHQGIGHDCFAFQPFSFSKVTYIGSLDYKVTDNAMVYGKVATGFRSGGGQLRLGGSGAPPFAPENVTDYEIGLKSEFFDRTLRLNLALYYDDYSGLQKTFLTVVNGAINLAVQNAGSAKIEGAEFDVTWKPIDSLTFGLNGAYTHPKYVSYIDPTKPVGAPGHDLSSQQFQGVAKWVWTLTGDYTRTTPFGELDANLSYWHTSDTPLQPGLPGPGGFGSNPWDIQKAYGLLDGRIALTLPGDKLTVALWGKNLLDKEYFTAGLDVTNTLGYAINYGNAPRTFGAEISYKF